MEARIERRTLKHTFTDTELLVLSEDLAVKNQDLNQQEAEKKSVVSQYGSKINELKEGINVLSTKVANKFEHRDVDCEVEYHTPERGSKTMTRGDNGLSFVEKMSDMDYDLFTQYQEESAEVDDNGDPIDPEQAQYESHMEGEAANAGDPAEATGEPAETTGEPKEHF